MVQACFHCGIPLQRSSQYIGIADVILGLLNFIIFIVHIREVYGGKGFEDLISSSDSYDSSSSSYGRQSSSGYRTRISNRTFPRLDLVPPELILTVAVCHAVQFLMGIVLYISAVNKNRNACMIWLAITAITALFTGLLFRLYEMLIVNEFTHELKQELEVSYFPGQQPIQVQLEHYHHHHHPQTFNQQVAENQPNHAGEHHVSVFTVPAPPLPPVTPAESGYTYNTSYYVNNGNPPPSSPYFPTITSMTQQQQCQHIPAALQPPPQYDVVVSGAYGGSNFAGGPQNGNISTGHTVESVIFPNDKNGYGKSFSKI